MRWPSQLTGRYLGAITKLNLKQLKIMKKLEMNEMHQIQGGKFWGEQQNCGGPIGTGTGTCYKMCSDDYYAFWIKVSTGKSEPVSTPCPDSFN